MKLFIESFKHRKFIYSNYNNEFIIEQESIEIQIAIQRTILV